MELVARERIRTDMKGKENNECANCAHNFREMLENKGFLVQSIMGATENKWVKSFILISYFILYESRPILLAIALNDLFY